MTSAKTNKIDFPLFSFSASILMHLVIFISAAIAFHLSAQPPDSNSGYVQVETNVIQIEPEQNIVEEKKEEAEEDIPDAVEETVKEPEKEIQKASSYLSFNPENTDTSRLNNIYRESTLDVTIKYPAGWIYLDQNVKNKLDGVTFIAASGAYNPPPYVHLAVHDKNIFIESRYRYNIKTRNYTAYYNDPEELSGQVSQTFYIRTDADEDYSIKFIMEGKDEFKSLQPVFFGMVKTFKFGRSLF